MSFVGNQEAAGGLAECLREQCPWHGDYVLHLHEGGTPGVATPFRLRPHLLRRVSRSLHPRTTWGFRRKQRLSRTRQGGRFPSLLPKSRGPPYLRWRGISVLFLPLGLEMSVSYHRFGDLERGHRLHEWTGEHNMQIATYLTRVIFTVWQAMAKFWSEGKSMAATPTSSGSGVSNRHGSSESPSEGMDADMIRGELITLEMRLVGPHAVEHMIFEAVENLVGEFCVYISSTIELGEPFLVLGSVLGLAIHREALRRQGDPAFEIKPGDAEGSATEPQQLSGVTRLSSDKTSSESPRFAQLLLDVEALGHTLLELTDSLDLAQTPDAELKSESLCAHFLASARSLLGDDIVRRPFAVALKGATAAVCGRLQKLNDASGVLGLKHVQLLRHCMRVATTESLGIALDLVFDLYRAMSSLETVEDPREAVAGVFRYAESLAPYDAELKTAIQAIQKGESPTWEGGRSAHQRSRRGSQPLVDLLSREFGRHDVDKDGKLTGPEELTQLSTTLCAKLRLLVSPIEIHQRVEAALSIQASWSEEAFEDWFEEAFRNALPAKPGKT